MGGERSAGPKQKVEQGIKERPTLPGTPFHTQLQGHRTSPASPHRCPFATQIFWQGGEAAGEEGRKSGAGETDSAHCAPGCREMQEKKRRKGKREQTCAAPGRLPARAPAPWPQLRPLRSAPRPRRAAAPGTREGRGSLPLTCHVGLPMVAGSDSGTSPLLEAPPFAGRGGAAEEDGGRLYRGGGGETDSAPRASPALGSLPAPPSKSLLSKWRRRSCG